MIGDLLPNIANDPKLSGETKKGSIDAAVGEFSILLKNFEQEVQNTGILKHQRFGESQSDGEISSPTKQLILLDESETPKTSPTVKATVDVENEVDVESGEFYMAQKNKNGNVAIENPQAEVTSLLGDLIPGQILSENEPIKNSAQSELSKSDSLQTDSVNVDTRLQVTEVETEGIEITNSPKSEVKLTKTDFSNTAGNDVAAELTTSDVADIQPAIDLTKGEATSKQPVSEVGKSDTAKIQLLTEFTTREIAGNQLATGVSTKHASGSQLPVKPNFDKKTGSNTEIESKTTIKQIPEVEGSHDGAVVSNTTVAKSLTGKENLAEKTATLVNRRMFARSNEALENFEQSISNNKMAQIGTDDRINPVNVAATQSSEIVQVIQQNRADTKVTKEVKNHRFALSNSEQAETRLKLLVDTVRPEILSNRELSADFNSTTTDVELEKMFTDPGALTNEQEFMLKDLTVETSSGKEANTSDNSNLGFLRLNELSVMNTTARRSIVTSFGKVLQENLKADNANQSQQWQKHSFKLEEGNSIDLTTRNIDGVLHIKLVASNPEISKMLQSMEQEIKDHLKEELNLELDLQFDQNEKENDAESLQKGIINEKAKLAASQARELLSSDSGKTNSGLNPSIRNFGYNQMEWTA